MRRRRRKAAGAVLFISLFFLATGAFAGTSCNQASARAELAALKDALQRPDALAAMDAAKADFAADQRFDNPHDAKYLAAAAAYFKIERHLDAGDVADACQFLQEADGLIDDVLAGQ